MPNIMDEGRQRNAFPGTVQPDVKPARGTLDKLGPKTGLLVPADKDKLNGLVVDTGWQPITTYGGTWGPYTTVQPYVPAWRRLSTGEVIYRGLVKSTTAPASTQIMFNTPAAYPPLAEELFALYTPGAMTEVRTMVAGYVRVGDSLVAPGAATYTNLTGLRYMSI